MFSAQETTPTRRSVSTKHLISTVCDYFEITQMDLLGKSRKRELVIPRQIIMYLMREEIQASYPTIGNEIGKRDHTTVMHACDKIKEAVQTDEKIRQDVLMLRQKMYTTA
jgi:chromosomal replication initiator protein